MAKSRTSYRCIACGAVHAKWEGKCPSCGEWDSLVEMEDVAAVPGLPKTSGTAKALKTHTLQHQGEAPTRMSTGLTELDRVLGGGLVHGSATLIGGDPGIGKSTLLLQLAAKLSLQDKACLYITGEESPDQVRLRAVRLGVEKAPVALAASTRAEEMMETILQTKPALVVIDSIQTMALDSLASTPGSITQVRGCAQALIACAKQCGSALILVGHVTKEGQIAGPKVLEHMVDSVLYFEGEGSEAFRLLRTVKNRFGAAGEIGVFAMHDTGLSEVANPSALFISGKAGQVPGSVVFPGMKGTRTVLTEIQALVAPTTMATPRRTVVGWDGNRLAMVLAVLQTHAGLKLMDKEVYLNVAGGMKIQEPAADMAVAAAIASALSGVALPKECVVLGEIGLSGEIRPVGHLQARLKEALRLGFTRALLPPLPENAPSLPKGIAAQATAYVHEIKKILSE